MTHKEVLSVLNASVEYRCGQISIEGSKEYINIYGIDKEQSYKEVFNHARLGSLMEGLGQGVWFNYSIEKKAVYMVIVVR